MSFDWTNCENAETPHCKVEEVDDETGEILRCVVLVMPSEVYDMESLAKSITDHLNDPENNRSILQ